jgi:hypothetical protein
MESKSPSEDLLQEFLSGETSGPSLSRLAAAAEEDPALASRLRDELAFSELIREAFRGGEEHAAESFAEAASARDLTFEELSEKVCDGQITQTECDQLVKMLWEEPDRISGLRNRLAIDEWIGEATSFAKGDDAFMEALETRMWAETNTDHFVQDFEQRLDQEIAERQVGQPGNVVRMPASSWGGTLVSMGAVAAAVAVGAFFLVQQLTGDWITERAVATVTKESSDAKWVGNFGPDADGEVAPGKYELESGVVSLKFVSGGELTVEGPAIFDVASDESTFVYHGVAMAKSATPGTGIAIRSKGIRVSEPVPLIGIDARGENSTEAIAFSGNGGVCLADGGGCRELFEMEAIKADLIRDKFVSIPLNARPFEKTWELLSGVEKNMGSVRIELPGTKIEAADGIRGESEVQVFVENESFHPETDLQVDQMQVGQFADAGTNPGQALQASGDLRSYLLQLWPLEGVDGEEVEASLTFDHPVVGVIFSSDRLKDSDLSVGTAITLVGEEFNLARGLDSGSDQLLLSDDRRTLNLKLRGGDLQVDQVRVLVALN